MKKIREQIRFTGRVQGVGFRYTANALALSLGITGWVQNDWDGSVLMEAQGTKVELDELIAKLQVGTFIQIDSIQRVSMQVNTSEKSFKVKY